MAKCDLTIELDQSNEVFHPGDIIFAIRTHVLKVADSLLVQNVLKANTRDVSRNVLTA